MDKKEKIIKYISKAPEKLEKRVLRFVGSDEGIDRDNEKVMSEGWNLKEYKKNPVVLVNHQHTELPVAKAIKVFIDKKAKNNPLTFDIEFPEPEISSVGDTLYKLYSNGYMSATSVGFKPDYDKIVYGDGMKTPRVIFNGQELLELSLVSVPANPRALLSQKGITDAIEAEVIDQLELDELESWMKELFPEEDKAVVDDKSVDDEETKKEIEQTINTGLCYKCGKQIKDQDDSDSSVLDELFEDFGKEKTPNIEDEDKSVVDELLNDYFNGENQNG